MMFFQVLKWFARNLTESTHNSNYTIQENNFPNTHFEWVNVQVQDETGMWRTTATSQNEPQLYRTRMLETANFYPNQRIRVVNDKGSVIDIM
jgi:hypothetical protein